MQVRLGADHHPGGERRSVRAVLRVQHHVGVHQRRGILAGPLALEHVEKVGGVAELPARRHRVASLADVVVRGHDHRHLGGEPDPLAAGGLERVVARLGVEGGERGHGRAQHVHGMRVLHRADDVEDGAGHLARLLERRVEGIELGRGGEIAVKQEIRGLLERRVRRQVVDRVATVPEFAGTAVDERRGRTVEAQVLQAAVHRGLIRVRHELRPLPVRRWLQVGHGPSKIGGAPRAPGSRASGGMRILTGAPAGALTSMRPVACGPRHRRQPRRPTPWQE